jgi:ankyrin repeat protein
MLPQNSTSTPSPEAKESVDILENAVHETLEASPSLLDNKTKADINRVIQCLIYIKQNYSLISDTIDQPQTGGLYRNEKDRKAKLLRDSNGTSFHLNAYQTGEEAIRGLRWLIEQFEATFVKLKSQNNELIYLFLNKLHYDELVGCLEARIAPALSWAVKLESRDNMADLHELMETCRVQYEQTKPMQSLSQFAWNYCQQWQHTRCIYNEETVDITPELLQDYTSQILGYEVSSPVPDADEKPQPALSLCASFEQYVATAKQVFSKRRQGYYLYFATEQQAYHAIAIIRRILSHWQLPNHWVVKQNISAHKHPFYIRLSIDQFESLNQWHWAETFGEQIFYIMIKSLRSGPECFASHFFAEVTRCPCDDEKHEHPKRRRLRIGKKKKFTVYGDGVARRDQKKPMYSPEEKAGFSKAQSTTCVPKHLASTIPAFGHNRDDQQALVGVIFMPEDVRFNRLLLRDIGTVRRPYDFHTEEGAEEYFKKMTDPRNRQLFAREDFDAFIAALTSKRSEGKHNEVLARLRWSRRSLIAIFRDTFESRCVAQFYAELARQYFLQQHRHDEQEWQKLQDYEPSIVYYLPGNLKSSKPYTQDERLADKNRALEIIKNEKKFIKAINQRRYEFLLLIEKDAGLSAILQREITWMTPRKKPASTSLIMKMYLEGRVVFANALLQRAGISIDQLDWSKIKEINGLIPHYSFIKFIIESEQIQLLDHLNETQLNGYFRSSSSNSHLMTAIQLGDQEVAYTLLTKVRGLQLNHQNRDGQTALIEAVTYGYDDIVEALLSDTSASDDDNSAQEPIVDPESTSFSHSQKTDLNLQNKFGSTALMYAATQRHKKTTKLLISKGALPNLADMNENTALHLTASGGTDEIVRILSQSPGIKTNLQNEDGDTALHLAAGNGHHTTVQILLEASETDAKLENENGNTALHLAASNGHHLTVQMLLGSGKVDANAKNNDGNTALHLAASNGHHRIVQILLGSGKVDANAKNNDKDTALHLAASNGHHLTVQTLAEHNETDVNAQGKDKNTPLMSSIKNEHFDIAKKLLELDKTNPNLQDKNLDTALILAIKKNNVPLSVFIINLPRTDVNLQDKNKNTPLIWSASQKNIEISSELLKAPTIDPKRENAIHATALTAAVASDTIPLVKIFLNNYHFDINSRMKRNGTLLMVASENGFLEIVNILLSRPGIEINLQDNQGHTALMLATSNNHHKIVERLLEEGADVTSMDKHGITALMWAAKKNHHEVMKILLTHKVARTAVEMEEKQSTPDITGVNLRNSHGGTALMIAAAEGYCESLRLLIDSGADVNLQSLSGNTALMFAIANNNQEIVKILANIKETNVLLQDQEGNTALAVAVTRGHDEVMRILLPRHEAGEIKKIIRQLLVSYIKKITKPGYRSRHNYIYFWRPSVNEKKDAAEYLLTILDKDEKITGDANAKPDNEETTSGTDPEPGEYILTYAELGKIYQLFLEYKKLLPAPNEESRVASHTP